MEPIALHDGRIMQVHEEGDCAAKYCCIHNPSDHPLKTAPLSWASRVHTMFRICPHDFAHPDPDDLIFKLITLQFEMVETITWVHLTEGNCDGCCDLKEESG